jgi:Ca2+/Na+ antiporter
MAASPFSEPHHDERSDIEFLSPYALATVILISLIMMTNSVSRWAGALLVLIYFGFVAGSYLVE